MKTYFAVLCALTLAQVSPCASASAQDSTTKAAVPPTKIAWVSGRDFLHIGLATASVGVLSLADESVGKSLQRSSARGNTTIQHAANFIQTAGDPGALLISASLYVVGAATHHNGLADASLHSMESIAVSGAITQVLKLSIGRERPNLSHDENAFAFHPFHGNHPDFNSFPSGHTTASFAAAAVFSNEIRRLHPSAGKITTPLLYGVATLVGVSRMYNDRHWLSDVAGGALIGYFVGDRITKHAHATN